MKRNLIILLVFLVVLSGAFFYFTYQVRNSKMSGSRQEFEIKKGQGAKEVGIILEERGLIKDDVYFFYYLWSKSLAGKILPGNYDISPTLTIPELVSLITQEQEKEIKITFPEGWTAKQMAERLTE
ncbi:MAG: endolytic transglycosylase MltG, partial [Patescibacteria group bacterium]